MSDAKLPKKLALSLLSKLAHDDDFRARFEAAPARALVEIGVPADVVVNLNSACIERRVLASKETFQNMLRENVEAVVASAMQMHAPQLGFRDSGRGIAPRPTASRVPADTGTALH